MSDMQINNMRKAIKSYQARKDGADAATETTLARKVVKVRPIDSS